MIKHQKKYIQFEAFTTYYELLMPSPKKQPTKLRIRSSLKAYAKTPNGYVLFRACGIGAIVMGSFLSLFCFVFSVTAAFTSSTMSSLLLFASLVFLVLSIVGCVIAIANHTSLRKARGRHQLPSAIPRWLSVVCGTIAAMLVLGVVVVIFWYLIAMFFMG